MTDLEQELILEFANFQAEDVELEPIVEVKQVHMNSATVFDIKSKRFISIDKDRLIFNLGESLTFPDNPITLAACRKIQELSISRGNSSIDFGYKIVDNKQVLFSTVNIFDPIPNKELIISFDLKTDKVIRTWSAIQETGRTRVHLGVPSEFCQKITSRIFHFNNGGFIFAVSSPQDKTLIMSMDSTRLINGTILSFLNRYYHEFDFRYQQGVLKSKAFDTGIKDGIVKFTKRSFNDHWEWSKLYENS